MLLSNALCPWLRPALEQLEAARAGSRLGHAWLIHGAEGIGKTNLALVFANRLLGAARTASPDSLSADDFLNDMINRHEARNHHPDLHWLFPEPGKSTISVEQVREVCESLALSSYSGSPKVVVIEPAEAMTTAASNALLKTLEEPTDNCYLLLVSHRPGVLPATVRSRCQKFGLRPPERATVESWAQRGAAADGAAQTLMPAQTPLHWLEELQADGSGDLANRSQQLADVFLARGNPLEIADEWAKRDTDHVLEWLVRTLHGLIRVRCDQHGSKLITDSVDAGLHNAASALSLRRLFDRLEEAERLRRDLAGGLNVQLAMRALVLGLTADKGMT